MQTPAPLTEEEVAQRRRLINTMKAALTLTMGRAAHHVPGATTKVKELQATLHLLETELAVGTNREGSHLAEFRPSTE